MATKKPTSSKQTSATSSLKIISWLKFLPNIPKKRLAIILLTIIVLSYAAFVTIRSLYGGYCNDWVSLSGEKLSLESMTFDRPDKWQMHYCFNHPEEDYQSIMLLDYQIPDLARLAWISGFSDGWGMFAPTNAGRIEIATSAIDEKRTLDEIEEQWQKFASNDRYTVETRRLKIDGFDALEVINYSEPEPAIRPRNSSGRHGYVKDIVLEVSDRRYSFRLSNSWHKSESRDAWVAKYEPVFDHLISTAEFK